MFEAILWDMDGTIVDTERVVWETMRRAFADAAGIELDEALFEQLMGRSEADFYRAMTERFALTARDLAAVQARFDQDYLPRLREVPALPGAIETVRELHARAPQALVTGSTGEQARTVLSALGIAECFREVVSCDTYERGKPDPEPFLLAARLLGAAPAACLVLEDSPSGVSAAIAAGMKVVAIHEGNAGKYNIAHAHVELASLTDFNWNEILKAFKLGAA